MRHSEKPIYIKTSRAGRLIPAERKKDMDIEKLNERLKEKLTIEEYQQLSALMFRTLDKYFWNAEKALKERESR